MTNYFKERKLSKTFSPNIFLVNLVKALNLAILFQLTVASLQSQDATHNVSLVCYANLWKLETLVLISERSFFFFLSLLCKENNTERWMSPCVFLLFHFGVQKPWKSISHILKLLQIPGWDRLQVLQRPGLGVEMVLINCRNGLWESCYRCILWEVEETQVFIGKGCLCRGPAGRSRSVRVGGCSLLYEMFGSAGAICILSLAPVSSKEGESSLRDQLPLRINY